MTPGTNAQLTDLYEYEPVTHKTPKPKSVGYVKPLLLLIDNFF